MGISRISRLVVLILALAVAATPGRAAYPFVGPDDVKVGDFIWIDDSYGSTNGGEFIVHPHSPASFTAFETFCIETTEYITLGSGQKYLVGGITGSAFYGSVGPAGDPLDPRTAYLFYHFRQGTLFNYDYGTGALRVASADDLQRAIWWIEGESGGSNAGQAGTWIAEATGKWNDIGPVRVLNLYAYNSQTGAYDIRAQDLLVIVPIPEPVFFQLGALAGMGGLGLLRLRRR